MEGMKLLSRLQMLPGLAVLAALVSLAPNLVVAALPAPTGVKATPGTTGITVTWNAVTGAVKYAVYQGKEPGKEDTIPLTDHTAGTSFVDTSGIKGTYYYKVVAIDASGAQGAFSAEATAVGPSNPSALPSGDTTVTSNPAANPPGADNACHFVLVTIKNASGQGITDCNHVSFVQYFTALLDSFLPYVLLLSIVAIVYSGLQYMLASAGAGDTKAAKQRVLGILTGVVFYFLIRLILNQLAPGISL